MASTTTASAATFLPFINNESERNKELGDYKTASLELTPNISKEILQFAQSNRLTLNTVMQGVWAELLHRYTGSSDVIFGTIVSGRPDDLQGVEKRVGMYINTLPMRSVKGEENKTTNLHSIDIDG